MVGEQNSAGKQRCPAQQLTTLHCRLSRRGVGHHLGRDTKRARQPSEAIWTRDLASFPIMCRLSGRATLPAFILSRSSYQGGHVGERQTAAVPFVGDQLRQREAPERPRNPLTVLGGTRQARILAGLIRVACLGADSGQSDDRTPPSGSGSCGVCLRISHLDCHMLSTRGAPLMTLMLAVIVVGLPLVAWLADLALLDAAATRSWIEALVRDVEDRS
jgi:hypothetical protein